MSNAPDSRRCQAVNKHGQRCGNYAEHDGKCPYHADATRLESFERQRRQLIADLLLVDAEIARIKGKP